MSDDAEDENALVQLIAEGDPRALEVLHAMMRARVFGVALGVTGDRSTAEDVVQDTFVRVYRAAGDYQHGTRARSWVLTIARHLALDAVRRGTREPPSGVVAPPVPAPDSEPDASRLDLANALLQLDGVDRQIVVLHCLGGLTHSEVAEELQLPTGTVRWRYRVALARLRPLVAEEVAS